MGSPRSNDKAYSFRCNCGIDIASLSLLEFSVTFRNSFACSNEVCIAPNLSAQATGQSQVKHQLQITSYTATVANKSIQVCFAKGVQLGKIAIEQMVLTRIFIFAARLRTVRTPDRYWDRSVSVTFPKP